MKHKSVVNSVGSYAKGGDVSSNERNLLGKRSHERGAVSGIVGSRKQNGGKMIDIITGFYCFLRASRIENDGVIFRLHAMTTILILTFSVIISSKQVVGNPIDCLHTREIPVEAFNAYCWIHSTYFVTGAMLGANVAAPGVAPSLRNFHFDRPHHRKNDSEPSIQRETTRNVKYYQWVVFVLIFQLVQFLWLLLYVYFCEWEIYKVTKDLTGCSPTP